MTFANCGLISFFKQPISTYFNFSNWKIPDSISGLVTSKFLMIMTKNRSINYTGLCWLIGTNWQLPVWEVGYDPFFDSSHQDSQFIAKFPSQIISSMSNVHCVLELMELQYLIPCQPSKLKKISRKTCKCLLFSLLISRFLLYFCLMMVFFQKIVILWKNVLFWFSMSIYEQLFLFNVSIHHIFTDNTHFQESFFFCKFKKLSMYHQIINKFWSQYCISIYRGSYKKVI